MKTLDYQNLKKVLISRKFELLKKRNVVAVGIGHKEIHGKRTGIPALVCSVKEKVQENELSGKDIIPNSLEGCLTDVKLTGEIKALRTGKYRPAPGGVSIGHVYITAGTLGCLVVSNVENKTYILSNNHVLANCNRAKKGDTITQPGMHDGANALRDKIAELYDFVPINFEQEESDCFLAKTTTEGLNFIARVFNSGSRLKAIHTNPKTNLVDAAIAKPIMISDVSPKIIGIGHIDGIKEGKLGMEIMKSGRTTAVTAGIIEQTDAVVKVNFGSDGEAIFEDQLISGIKSNGGDSGSVVLEKGSHKAVGLLFAGNTSITIMNKIENVCDALDVEVM